MAFVIIANIIVANERMRSGYGLAPPEPFPYVPASERYKVPEEETEKRNRQWAEARAEAISRRQSRRRRPAQPAET